MMLKDKVALVTGGTSGIGRATAIAFGKAGAKVVFSGRREAKGEETAKLIRETGAECLFVRSDVSIEAEVQALVEKTILTYGRLDCVFNNAGFDPPIKPLHEQSLEDYEISNPTDVESRLGRDRQYFINEWFVWSSGDICPHCQQTCSYGIDTRCCS
jgi:NAD(P)-dependent dehydrogenase (short-subunit alcohol dehydrogenase family)